MLYTADWLACWTRALKPSCDARTPRSYVDVEGRLCGEPGACCFIEVKSTEGDGGNPFFVSSAQWALACKVSLSRRQREQRRRGEAGGSGGSSSSGETAAPLQFIIVRVARALSQPHIAAVLVDPVELFSCGELSFGGKLTVDRFPLGAPGWQ